MKIKYFQQSQKVKRMINKKYILEFVFLITVLLSVSFISSAYVRSVNYGQYTGVGGGSLFGETASLDAPLLL